jgi:cation diffusion facilitator family transporter
MQSNSASNIRMQRLLVFVSLALFIIKFIAWYITHSVAILTDALESTVNVAAGFIGLYSIHLSSKPKDKEHPYGHGKVEFLTSAIEGILISIAGFFIIYEAYTNIKHPHHLKQLDYGLILISISAIINYLVGYACVKKGRLQNSPVLIGSGSHLISDTYSTIGLIVGIGLVMITKINWIDSLAAFIFAIVIIYTGYKIIRKAIAGIMDESDEEVINQVVEVLNKNRRPNWIDVHNLRVIDYAGFYHIDCHLTVPYYYTVKEAHEVLDSVSDVLKNYFDERVEFFIHMDACIESQCEICSINECSLRKFNFNQPIEWTSKLVLSNEKHTVKAFE